MRFVWSLGKWSPKPSQTPHPKPALVPVVCQRAAWRAAAWRAADERASEREKAEEAEREVLAEQYWRALQEEAEDGYGPGL